jgi:GNAT superfamily N-acetyltransferase
MIGHCPGFELLSSTIRPFCAKDTDTVNRLALAAWEQCQFVLSDWPRSKRALADIANIAAYLETLVASVDGQVAGLVGYVPPGGKRVPMFPPEWAVIRMLSVDPEYRGRGLGRQLSETCIICARRDGSAIIGLHTSPVMHVALSMYLGMGFVHHRDIPERNGVPYALYSLAL